MSVFVPRRVSPSPAVLGEKAILGSGAASMLTLQPLWTAFNAKPQDFMRQAQQVYLSNPWVFAAEEVVSTQFATIDWHLEDEQDNEIDDAYPVERARAVRDLFERPQANVALGAQLTRRELWQYTARDMGICGNAFWLLDQQEALARTPLAFLYINPVRMTPAEDSQGNLTGWVLDYRDAAGTGLPLRLDEVLHFKLAPPITGHFGIGKVQSAMSKVSLTRLADTHAADTLAAGGRLAGIVSAKSGASIPDGTYQQLVRDLRTVADSTNSAKRMTVVQGPVDFTRTAATASELSLLDLMAHTKEDLLSLWGVPLSQIGGSSPAGLNSGDVRKYDEAALWQNAIHPRLVAFWEVIQYQLVDRFGKLGLKLHLELEEPEFDDDSPRYDLVQKSINLPMRHRERRALIGLDPFGPNVIDPATGLPLDDSIVLPATLVPYAVAPETETDTTPTERSLGRGTPSEVQTAAPSEAAAAAGETTDAGAVGKARTSPLHASMAALRANVERTTGDRLRASVARFLETQKRELAATIRDKGAHLARRPSDQDAWWRGRRWDKALEEALRPHLAQIATAVASHVPEVLPATGKAKTLRPAGGALMTGAEAAATEAAAEAFVERVLSQVLDHGAARVTAINETTRDAIQKLIDQGVREGLSPGGLGDLIESATPFDEYRAEMIGRTELMTTYNEAALGSYGELGLDQVQAIDGDADDVCAARNGNVYTLDEAAAESEHPNGTLDWVPWIA